jgi:hypothetical protein
VKKLKIREGEKNINKNLQIAYLIESRKSKNNKLKKKRF